MIESIPFPSSRPGRAQLGTLGFGRIISKFHKRITNTRSLPLSTFIGTCVVLASDTVERLRIVDAVEMLGTEDDVRGTVLPTCDHISEAVVDSLYAWVLGDRAPRCGASSMGILTR